jgi:hypothetical protein
MVKMVAAVALAPGEILQAAMVEETPEVVEVAATTTVEEIKVAMVVAVL